VNLAKVLSIQNQGKIRSLDREIEFYNLPLTTDSVPGLKLVLGKAAIETNFNFGTRASTLCLLTASIETLACHDGGLASG
jgi:hypothetical protein